MDRRAFIANAAAAAAMACSGSSARARHPAMTHVRSTRRTQDLVLACTAPESAAGVFDDARMLARDLERVVDGHFKINLISGSRGSIDAVSGQGADLFYGPEIGNTIYEPALHFVAGLPGQLALDGHGLRTFMEQYNGAAKWANTLEAYGVTPIYAGHAGPEPLVWSRTRVSTLAGQRIATSGLNAELVSSLGGTNVTISEKDFATALRDGHVDGLEIASLTQAIALKIPSVARCAVRAPLSKHAGALSLAVHTRIWKDWSPSIRAQVCTCINDFARKREVREKLNSAVLRPSIEEAYGVIIHTIDDSTRTHRLSEAIVAEIAGRNDQTIWFNRAYMAALYSQSLV